MASQPANVDAGRLRMTLRPPSHPTRYPARSDPPSASSTSTPLGVLRAAGHLGARRTVHVQLGHPAGQDLLEAVLPQRQAPYGRRVGKSLMSSTVGKWIDLDGLAPPPRNARRPRAGRAPRSCAPAAHPPASSPARVPHAARRSPRRPRPAPVRPPASSPPGRRRRSPPHARAYPFRPALRRLRQEMMRHTGGLESSPPVRCTLDVEGARGAPFGVLGGGLAVRQLPARPREVAGVAVRDPLQVVLVLGLGLPERDGLAELGHDLAGPQARGVDVGDRVLGDLALLVARVEDLRAVATSRCRCPGGPWSSGRGSGRRTPGCPGRRCARDRRRSRRPRRGRDGSR